MKSDNEIAGDPTALPHLLPPARQHPGTVAEFAGLLDGIARCRGDWAPLVEYDPVSRWYHRLRTGPGYEVWLLSWLPGQGSGQHAHGPSHGVYRVLAGELTERAAALPAAGPGQRSRRAVRRVLRPGGTRVFAPGYVHEMLNTALLPAVSAHVYFPGLTEMPALPRRTSFTGRHPGARPNHQALPSC